MAKWYVECKVRRNGRAEWIGFGKIEAKDGKEAIEWVKQHKVIGGYKYSAYRDDDEEVEQ